MSNDLRKILIGLVAVAAFFGLWYWNQRRFSAEVRETAYKRYADVAAPEVIKPIVDRYHKEIFDQCYTPGYRRTKARFDVERYARLMDAKVRGELSQLLTDARLSELEERNAARRGAGAARLAAAAATPTPSPTPDVHAVEIRALSAKGAPAETVAAGMPVKVALVDIDIFDARQDLSGRGDRSAVAFTLHCRRGGEYATQRAQRVSSSDQPFGVKRFVYKLQVPEGLIGSEGDACDLVAQVTDDAGNTSSEARCMAVLR